MNHCLSITVLLTALALPAGERLTYRAPLLDAAPVLDGKLDDSCWQAVPEQTGFVRPLSGKPAGQPSWFRIACTREALYVAVRCTEPSPDAMRARHADHDGPLWGDDCVELFLAPADNGMEYVQVIVNTLGAVWDAHVTQMGISSDVSFETGTRAAATVDTDSWSVEIEVPFAGLALEPGTGRKWGINVARERKPKPSELSCWVHTGVEKFGIPGKFGLLMLPELNFGRFAWHVGGFALRDPQFNDKGATDVTLTCEVRSLTGSTSAVSLTATVFQENGATSTASGAVPIVGVGGGEASLPIRVTGAVTSVRYRLADATTGEVVALGARDVNLSCAPLQLRLLSPWYRDTIFASCPIEAIDAEVVVHGRTGRLDAVLAREGHVLARAAIDALPGETTAIRLPAKNLEPGRYILRVTLADGSATAEKVVTVLPPKPGEVCLDRRSRLLVDGKPFFAWGFFSAPPGERLAKAGFNTVQTYIAYYIHRDKDLTAWLDSCHENGIKAVMYPYFGEVGCHVNAKKKRFSDKELARTAEFVRLYKDHPAVLGWYLCDEPRGTVFRSEMKRVRDVVAAEDPYHPCIVLDNTGRGVAGLADAGEILWVDPYPGFAKNGPPRLPLNTVSIAMDDMIRGTGNRLRHFWAAPQAFNWGAWGGDKAATERAPTYDEERTMTYLAIVHGAQGVVYFAWKYTLMEPNLAKGILDRLGPEVKSLIPELLEGEDVEGVLVENAPSDAKLHVRVLRRGKRITVIAVNPGPVALKTRLSVPGLGVRDLEVVSEARIVRASNGTIRDHFAPYATHIYIGH